MKIDWRNRNSSSVILLQTLLLQVQVIYTSFRYHFVPV